MNTTVSFKVAGSQLQEVFDDAIKTNQASSLSANDLGEFTVSFSDLTDDVICFVLKWKGMELKTKPETQ